jgi:hypothetical protein
MQPPGFRGVYRGYTDTRKLPVTANETFSPGWNGPAPAAVAVKLQAISAPIADACISTPLCRGLAASSLLVLPPEQTSRSSSISNSSSPRVSAMRPVICSPLSVTKSQGSVNVTMTSRPTNLFIDILSNPAGQHATAARCAKKSSQTAGACAGEVPHTERRHETARWACATPPPARGRATGGRACGSRWPR